MEHLERRPPRLRIDASNTHWFALLDETENGIEVQIWKQMPSNNGDWAKLEGRSTYDAPMHVVRDEVLRLLETLPVVTWGQARR